MADIDRLVMLGLLEMMNCSDHDIGAHKNKIFRKECTLKRSQFFTLGQIKMVCMVFFFVCSSLFIHDEYVANLLP